MEWTDEKCLELINCYQKKEILWQPRHCQHCNRQRKQDAWEEIGRSLHVDSDECKKKMSSLSSSFRRENARMKKSRGTGSGRDDIYNSSWFAFKAMLFMQDKDEPRPRLNTLLENDNSETHEESEAPPVDIVDSRDTAENEIEPPPSSRPPATRKNKKRVNEERMDKAFNMLETMHSGRPEETEHDIFGKLVASKLKRYSPHVSSMVQEELMKVLFKADRGWYNIHTHTHSQPSTYTTHLHTPPRQLSTDYSSESQSTQQFFPTEYPSPSFSHCNTQSYHEL